MIPRYTQRALRLRAVRELEEVLKSPALKDDNDFLEVMNSVFDLVRCVEDDGQGDDTLACLSTARWALEDLVMFGE